MFPYVPGRRTLIHYNKVTGHDGRTHIDRLYTRGDGTAELVSVCLEAPDCEDTTFAETLDHEAVAAYLERKLEHGHLDGWAGTA